MFTGAKATEESVRICHEECVYRIAETRWTVTPVAGRTGVKTLFLFLAA